MASSRDVKDIMGLAMPNGAAPTAPVQKKAKPAAGKRLTGINREILALHGDRAPPVSIIDSTKTFRAKLKRDFRPAHWDFAQFENDARRDGLQLRHWKRHKPNKGPPTDAGSDAMDIETKDTEENEPYRFAKYNLDISVPQYDDDKYNTHLRNADWSREETDYLVGLVKEYAQKWPLIIDRYEWPPRQDSADSMALVRETRDLEALKARYYQVWSKCLALEHGGEAGMNETEFALYENLSKYNPKVERQRKELGWSLFERPLEDVREEEYLLAELQRIMINAQKYETERAEVRQRLDHPHTKPGAVPATFAELTQLYNTLFAQDRTRRARGRLSMNGDSIAQSPAGVNPSSAASNTNHRDSIGGGGAAQKKSAASASQPVRTLDARQERKYGVTSHDRLTSGVSFRTDKLLKLRHAKSQIQTQKIAAALTELGVPEILQLPTQRVMDHFEHLIQKIQKLIDARKLVEKEEAEARVQGALRKELQKDNGEAESGSVEPKVEEPEAAEEDEEEEEEAPEAGAEEDNGQDDEEDEEDGDGEGDDDDNEGEEGSQFEGQENDGEDEDDADGEDENADLDVDADGDGDEMDVDVEDES